MALKNEEDKDSSNQLKEQLDAYDLFRLNLILRPDGFREAIHNE